MVTTPTSNPTANVLVPVMRRADRVGFLVISVAMIAAIAWFAANWSSASDWKQFPFTLTFATVLVAIIVGTRVFRWALLPFMRRPRAIEPAPNLKVAVVPPSFPAPKGSTC
ncbi:MAG: hypothetical protein JOY79_10585 [Acidobacteriaceae bacterium]|nr:hypothetical protein [Acidobacteriaceae bacterium]